ncbi:PTS sugar transporter subunit IIA [Amedibacillus sp. YH-ame6]
MKLKRHDTQTPSMSIYFVCDAGMGSSAMCAGILQKKLKKVGCDLRIRNCAIEELPKDVDMIISHSNFASQIKKRYPNVIYMELDGFMDEASYERIVKEIMLFTKKEKNKILEKENILLNCKAENSDEAIVAMGNVLVKTGYVSEGYIQGMLNRDHDLTVYIGNDIAIPHGEYEVKDCVKKTGIAVMIYPEGIKWAEGTVRVVIGIAANNDEHMEILSNIADKLGDMEEVEKVVAGDVNTIYDILTRGDGA